MTMTTPNKEMVDLATEKQLLEKKMRQHWGQSKFSTVIYNRIQIIKSRLMQLAKEQVYEA